MSSIFPFLFKAGYLNLKSNYISETKPTRMEKMVSKLVFKMTLLMLMFQLAEAAAPVANFGCPDRCGDITIPYPFGTGKDCYKDEWFAVECNNTTNPPRAFISRINMEVLNISLETGMATVKSPVIFFNCTGRKDGGSLNLTGSPFVFEEFAAEEKLNNAEVEKEEENEFLCEKKKKNYSFRKSAICMQHLLLFFLLFSEYMNTYIYTHILTNFV
jgi:hypothetical protein